MGKCPVESEVLPWASRIQRSHTAVRVDVPGSCEYFRLANRQRLGSDWWFDRFVTPVPSAFMT